MYSCKLFTLYTVRPPPVADAGSSKSSRAKEEVRCILCHRTIGDQPGDAKTRCSLKRKFKMKEFGMVTLGPLIHEILGVDLEQQVDAKELNKLGVCLRCANALLKVKMKRQQLLEAEESVRSMKSENGYISRLTRFKRLKSRKQQLPSDIPRIFQESSPVKRKHPSGETSGSRPPSPSPSTSSSASSSSSSSSPKKEQSLNVGFKQQIAASILKSRYGMAFKGAFRKSSAGRQQLLDAVRDMAKLQMAKFIGTKQLKSLTQEFNADAVENFNWGSIMAELRENLPVLCAAVEGSLTTKANRERVHVDDDGEKIGKLVPGMGIILSMITKMRRPHKFKFIPSLLGMSLYKYGCRSTLVNNLSKIGICMTTKALRKMVKCHGQKLNSEILFEVKASGEDSEEEGEEDSEEDGEEDSEEDNEEDSEVDGETDSEADSGGDSEADGGGDSEVDGRGDSEADAGANSEADSELGSPTNSPKKKLKKSPTKRPTKSQSPEQPDGPTG